MNSKPFKSSRDTDQSRASDTVLRQIPIPRKSGKGAQSAHQPPWMVTGEDGGTPSENWLRAKQLLLSIDLVLRHHRCPEGPRRSLWKQMIPYLNCDEPVFFKRAKYLLTWPMARYLRNPTPPTPDKDFLPFRGRWWRWARERLHIFQKSNTHLWFSFLQAKRGAAPASQYMVYESYLAHREQMKQPDPISSGLLIDLIEQLEPILLRAGKYAGARLQEFFREPRPVHPGSLGACIEQTRKGGGQRGFLRDMVLSQDLHRNDEDLVDMSWHPYALDDRKRYATNLCLERRIAWESVENLWGKLSSYILRYEPHPLFARVEAVLEPLKIRIISKGEAIPYYIGKKIQKTLHDCLRDMKPFELIGRRANVFDIVDTADATLKGLHRYNLQYRFQYESSLEDDEREFEALTRGMSPVHLASCLRQAEAWPEHITPWQRTRIFDLAGMLAHCSVDYKAATDGLSASYSRAILTSLLGDLFLIDPRLHSLMLAVLAPHEISYPKVKIRDGEGNVIQSYEVPSVMQENGQLMGSILSFFVLCLANFGLFLKVRRTVFPEFSLKELQKQCLINGDDLYFFGTRLEYKLFEYYGKQIGLSLSVGKSYFHPTYANINSMSYHVTPRMLCHWDDATMTKTFVSNTASRAVEIPFFNVGLFTGQNKVMGKRGLEDEDTMFQTTSVMNELVSGFYRDECSWLGQYMTLHADEIRKECRGRNLFLPISCGGMGVIPPTGFKFSVTLEQKQWAAGFLRKYPYLVPDIRPLPEGVFLQQKRSTIIDPFSVPAPDDEVRHKSSMKSKALSRALLHGLVPYRMKV